MLDVSRDSNAAASSSAVPEEVTSSLRPWWRREVRPNLFVVGMSCVAFAGLSFLLYALSVHGNAPNSDGATIVLEGQSIAGGQIALHGWSLSLDSFWGVDAIIYAIAVAIAGVQAVFLHLIPALIAAAVVVVGALFARAGTRGLAGLAGAMAVVAILALPAHAFTMTFLLGPYHIGTTLWCLVAFAGVRRGRFGLGWIVAVVFLALGLLGDLQVVALGALPLLLAGIAASARCRRWSAGLPAASAVVASVVLAFVVREIAKAFGSYALISANPRAPLSAAGANVKLFFNYFPKLLGAGTNGFASNGAPYFTEYAHGIALIVVVVGVLVALGGLIVGIWRGDADVTDGSSAWRLEDPVLIAFIGGCIVFIELTVQPIASYSRYLAPSVIFGAILAGRLVTRLVRRLVERRDELPFAFPAVTAVAFATVVSVLAIGTAYEIDQPVHTSGYEAIGMFLEHHHLYEGVGDYWSSSIVTVDTNNEVRVRAITQAPSGKLVRYDRESTASWYAGKQFYFVVFNPTLQFGNVNSLTASQTFGRPLHTWNFGGLEILAWRHPFTVSTRGIT